MCVTQIQKILLFHLRSSCYQFAVLHAFRGNQFTGDLVHLVASTADYNYLQAVMLVQMNVQASVHSDMSLMLHVCQNITQVVHPMIINESDDTDDFGVCLPDLLLNQVIPDQIADRFRTILITLAADASVKRLVKVFLERHAKSGEVTHKHALRQLPHPIIVVVSTRRERIAVGATTQIDIET